MGVGHLLNWDKPWIHVVHPSFSQPGNTATAGGAKASRRLPALLAACPSALSMADPPDCQRQFLHHVLVSEPCLAVPLCRNEEQVVKGLK